MDEVDVTAAINTDKLKLLAAKCSSGKHQTGHWEFPGGKIELGKTLEQCLKRELKEEFTIEPEIGEFRLINYDQIFAKVMNNRLLAGN